MDGYRISKNLIRVKDPNAAKKIIIVINNGTDSFKVQKLIHASQGKKNYPNFQYTCIMT